MTARGALVLLLSAALFAPAAAMSAALEPLPPPPLPPDSSATPQMEALGKTLFFDRRLSGDGTMSCAVCHDPENGYGDGLPVSLGYPTTGNWRNAPTIINVAYRRSLHWDGRAGSLEEQALLPIASPFEMNRNLAFLEEALKEVPVYAEAFRRVFGGEITRDRVARALAAFERTIVSRNAPIDRYLRGDAGALTPLQKKGLDIFTGKGGCAVCHGGPTLSDGAFHNLGVPEGPKTAGDRRVAVTRRFAAKVSGFEGYRTLEEDPGRFLVTKDPRDRKAFLTPSLREVALTAPYMHDGVFRTLDETIDFFDRGGGPGKTALLSPLGLTPEEKEALKAFLAEALSGEVTKVRPPAVP